MIKIVADEIRALRKRAAALYAELIAEEMELALRSAGSVRDKSLSLSSSEEGMEEAKKIPLASSWMNGDA